MLTWKLRCNDDRSVLLLLFIPLSHINYECVIHFHYSMRFSIKRNKREIIQILEYSKHSSFLLHTHYSFFNTHSWCYYYSYLCASFASFFFFSSHSSYFLIYFIPIAARHLSLHLICYFEWVWFAFGCLVFGFFS